MSITSTHNLTEIDKKIQYLLKEKSNVLEDELRMTVEVLEKIKINLQRYSPDESKTNLVHQKCITLSHKSKSMAFLGIMIALPILFISVISSDNFNFVTDDKPFPMKSGYVIQNLKGDTVDTFHSWDIPKERTLYVNIANPNVIDNNKLQIIQDSILSEKTILLDNSIFHKDPLDSKSTYFVGWTGALKHASANPTRLLIPTKFSVSDSSTNGDISIILSTLESPDGYSGFTRSTVENNQILKSTITIYKANQLSSAELETITRHEFGHAIGLIHSSDPSDLMHSVIETNYPYISDCDVSAVIHLYDGNSNDKAVCQI